MKETAEKMAEAANEFMGNQQMFSEMWSDFMSKSMGDGFSFKPDEVPPETARRMRATFLKAWTEYCDEYMRSPQFLKSVKQSMDQAMDFRRQMNEFLGGVHHEMQGTSRQDIDQLMLALRHLEHRMVNASENLSAKTESIADRLDELEKKLSGTGAATVKPKASKPAAKKPAAKKARPAAPRAKRKTTKKKPAKKKTSK